MNEPKKYLLKLKELTNSQRIELNDIQDPFNFPLLIPPDYNLLNHLIQDQKDLILIYGSLIKLPQFNEDEKRNCYLPSIIKILNKSCPHKDNKEDLFIFKLYYSCYYAYLLQLNHEYILAETEYQTMLTSIKNKNMLIYEIGIVMNLILVYRAKGNSHLEGLLFKRFKKILMEVEFR